MRLLVAGVPRAGKTTLAMKLAAERNFIVRHTDSLMGLEWSEASAAAALWLNDAGPWIIEGVAVPRALRKWLAANTGAPCDVVYWMPAARVPLTTGQRSMAGGCITVWAEVLPQLLARGVEVLPGDG